MQTELQSKPHTEQRYESGAPEITTVYTAALLIAGTGEVADEAAVSAYAAVRSQCGAIDPGQRLQLLMREMVAVARKLALPQAPDTAGGSRYRQHDLFGQSLLCMGVDERVAVVLHDVSGLTRAEAAAVLGTSREEFGRLLTEGRLKLMKRMT